MAEVGRWVLVNRETHNIIDGPFLWDGETPWAPGNSPDTILESQAVAEGFTYPPPPPPDPEDPPQEPVYD